MTLTIGTASGNKTVGVMTLGTASGNKTVLAGYVGTAGGNKLFFTATPTVTAAPPSQTASGAAASYEFTPETATVTDGLGPYTYSWSFLTSNNGTFSFVGGISNTASVTPQVAGVPVATLADATLSCTVVDTTTGVSGESNTVTLQYGRS